jgi:hypothetical protein
MGQLVKQPINILEALSIAARNAVHPECSHGIRCCDWLFHMLHFADIHAAKVRAAAAAQTILLKAIGRAQLHIAIGTHMRLLQVWGSAQSPTCAAGWW